MPHAQALASALLVAGCGVYAVWTLMPAAARRAAAVVLLRLPLPVMLGTRLRAVARATSGCGCDGCDRSELKAKAGHGATAIQTITFHPRSRR